ncbi:MAG: VPLPA-CTERM sorting domain-containing protein [Paracoccaceae bacterium]
MKTCKLVLAATFAVSTATTAHAISATDPIEVSFFAILGGQRVDFGNTAADGSGSAFPFVTTFGDLTDGNGIDLFLPGSDDVNDAFNFAIDLNAGTFSYATPAVENAIGPQIPGGSAGAALEFPADFIGFQFEFSKGQVTEIGGNPVNGGASPFTFDTGPDFSSEANVLSRINNTGPGRSFSFNTAGTRADAAGSTVTFDIEVAHVPLPAPLALLVAGLAGLGFVARRKA